MIDQAKMEVCAINQALDRAHREHKLCTVYKRNDHPKEGVDTWYVRTPEEGEPEGALIVFFAKG
jgi:hypothetical protein